MAAVRSKKMIIVEFNMMSLSQVQHEKYLGQTVTIRGYVKDTSSVGPITFAHLYDGSLPITQMAQLVFRETEDLISKIRNDVYLEVEVRVIESPAKGQKYDLEVEKVLFLGEREESDNYIWSKKKIELQTIRKIPHMRIRHRHHLVIQSVRSELISCIHSFMHGQGFKNVHTPLVTFSDCEGAGEMFEISAPGIPNFFGKGPQPGLTVSGQLELETYCCAMGPVFTFGPTFRAEKSDTYRHLAEFWMMEPELPGTFQDLRTFVELFLRSIVKSILDSQYRNDLKVTGAPMELLEKMADSDAAGCIIWMTYTEAINKLRKHQYIGKQKKKRFEVEPVWGIDLPSEQEKFLCEKVGGAVGITHYPKSIKSFYMRESRDQVGPHGEPTVEAFDILVPGIGELIGGSAREEDLDKLTKNMIEKGMEPADYDWYLDLRRHGTMLHGGFGIGFERLVMLITGVSNIRDVIPFPRHYTKSKPDDLTKLPDKVLFVSQ